MSQVKIMFILISQFLLIWLTFLSSASPQSQQLIILSSEVGAAIDATENERYHLFSRDIGLIAARVYSKGVDGRQLHLIGENDGHPWILIRGLTMVEKQKLVTRILQVEKNSDQQFSEPVIKIELPQQTNAEHPLNLKLVDDTQLYGRIRFCSADTVQFVTLSGVNIAIPESQILEARWPQGEVTDGGFSRFDPANYRLFFGPTGRTLQKGEVNFSDFYVIFPSLAAGITDFLMIGGGVSLIPGASSQLIYLAPKINILHREKLDLAVGALYFGVPGEGGSVSAYSALTIGNPLGGVTLGVAIPFARNFDDDEFNFTALLFGGEKQISNRVKFITENWLIIGGGSLDGSLSILSGGFRLIGERLTADFALATSPEFFEEGVDFPFIPYVAFSVNFGR